MADAHFSDATLDFLQDLEVHNDKVWFEANRQRYEEHVKVPMLRFINDVREPLARVSEHVVADPRGNGGSMFRIHRDVRFSADKSPYKTNSGAQFRHAAGKDAHAPGFYLHVEPGNSGMAAGVWRPPTVVLTAIREAIVASPTAWDEVRGAVEGDGWSLMDEGALKRAPKGFDPDHRHIEDLRRTSFAVWRHVPDDELTDDGFLEAFTAGCARTAPLMRFLCGAIGVPF